MRTRIFLNPARVLNTAANTANSLNKLSGQGSFVVGAYFWGACLLGACLLSVLPGAAAQSPLTFHFRLSPGPRLVGTRADRSGGGSVVATLDGSKLTLKGSFSGLLSVPTGAHLFMGSLPGVRGPQVTGLTISPATTGVLSGIVQLTTEQLTALHNGGLYVEIDSDQAPEGDLWGWIMPQSLR
jgi:CHRD domain